MTNPFVPGSDGATWVPGVSVASQLPSPTSPVTYYGSSEAITGPYGIPTHPVPIPAGSIDAQNAADMASVRDLADLTAWNWAMESHAPAWIPTQPDASSGLRNNN